MAHDELFYQIALTRVPNVGGAAAKQLTAYCGTAREVFSAKPEKLLKIPEIGPATAKALKEFKDFAIIENELVFISKYKIDAIFITDKRYPHRLKHCADSPVMLYYKGNADLNNQKVISVVGTRRATAYGKDFCSDLLKGLSLYNPLVVSGLAYGVDASAHKVSIDNNLATVGVLGHGLDTIYPATHKGMAEKMLVNGGLLTEFMSKTKLHPDFFPRRNRIIAGMADATIVIEAADSGGALITAELANSYNREVFALPGKIGDKYSAGCNNLVKMNKAALITSPEDIIKGLNWDLQPLEQATTQVKLMLDLKPEEEALVRVLERSKDGMPIDIISINANLSAGLTASTLLNLEFAGIVKALPGKMYKLA